MITFQKRLLVGVVVAVITIAVAVDSNTQDQNPGNPSILKAVQELQTSVNALPKSDPIFLDISPASGGMNSNQGGRDESKAPEGKAGE